MTNFERFTEEIIIERRKKLDNAILGVIEQIATDYGIETKVILNEKAIVEALTEYAQKHYGGAE